MHPAKKVFMSVGALGAFALGGSALANATTGSPSPAPAAETRDAPDQPLTGAPASQAGTAAVRAVGGGKVVSVEKADEGGKTVYEVKVAKGNTTTEVGLARDFSVTSQAADDDTDKGDGESADDHGSKQDKGDGDGETADDHGSKQDKGDGDGETADDAGTATPQN